MHNGIKRTALAIRCALLVIPLALLIILVLPFLITCHILFVEVMERANGTATWYRRQRDGMVAKRFAIPDAEFVKMVGADVDEARFLLAIREAMADSIGVPKENIHPQDRMADLWRMQDMPDIMPIVFRLEEMLGARIGFSSLQSFERRPDARGGDFGEFATSAVKMLVQAKC